MKKALALAALAALFSAAPAAARAPTWPARIASATRYAEGRDGLVSFAVVDEGGKLRGYRTQAIAPSASVLKAMLLVAYLRKADVRARPLRDWERDLLGPMIRRSDNAAASAVIGLVGSDGVYRLARAAGMTSFRLHLPIWGLSEITARDQARFFYAIDSHVPARHRAYALRLLASIVPAQRWGVARVAPSGWTLHFKGGWGSGTGLVDHQVALLRASGERVSLAILTRFNPDHAYGKETLRGVAARLLHGLPRPLFSTAPAARFAFDAGHTASLDGGCGTLRLRALAGGRAVISTQAADCVSVRLALGGQRALWSWLDAETANVSTTTLDDPVPAGVATLSAGEVLRRLAGAGATLVFSHDSHDAGGAFTGARVTDLNGASCPAAEKALVTASAGRFAAGSGDTLEVRELASCDVVAAFETAWTVEAVALAGDLLAALLRSADGRARIARYSVSTETRLSTTRVPSTVTPFLDASAGWIVYRSHRTLVALAPGRRWTLWTPRRVPVGFAVSGRHVAWLENLDGRGRTWMTVLPKA